MESELRPFYILH